MQYLTSILSKQILCVLLLDRRTAASDDVTERRVVRDHPSSGRHSRHSDAHATSAPEMEDDDDVDVDSEREVIDQNVEIDDDDVMQENVERRHSRKRKHSDVKRRREREKRRSKSSEQRDEEETPASPPQMSG